MKTRTAAISGALAGFVALLMMLLGTTLTNSNGLLELVHNGVTAFIPLSIFDFGISTFGAYAKGLLFIGVASAVPVAGALLAAILLRLGMLPSRPAVADGLFAAALAFLAGEGLVLPIFGQGFFGSSYNGDQIALHAPFGLASLAYGLVLVGLLRGVEVPGSSASDVTAEARGDGAVGAIRRRTFLGRSLAFLSLGAFGASAFTILARVVAAGSTNSFERPRAQAPGGFGPTPLVTPVDQFYVVAKDLVPTTVDESTWRLRVSGLVNTPAEYTRADLQSHFTRVEGYRTLQCISNEVVTYGELIGNQRWAGVRVKDVLAAAGLQPNATYVLWRSADGYMESLPVEIAQRDSTWLADEMGPPGTPLTAEHGFPLRVLVAGRYGMKQPKYLTDIVLADHDEAGYWEERTWDETAAVRTYSRIDQPLDGDTVSGGTLAVFGVASSGDRGIAKVEVSLDGGSTWSVAELEQGAVGDSDLSWVRWRASLPVSPGRITITARATDGQGNVQDPTPRPTLPSGATGLDQVVVAVVPGGASPGAAGSG